ncbi:MAG: serine/threonine protein kinase [Acidobacteria bacterium]|nr:serine/threonine protein kinase [Acidobacteriota bacterium]MBV9476363.1 serine/threonine protein kinase [Acidobacteriota bacterium]
MTWLSDAAVGRLRDAAELPDFSGTRYDLVRELGRGGMGVVYEAHDRELDRRVAIKVLATETASPAAAERMRAEARVVARLEHPGIVPLHDAGTLADGRIYYAMKLVRGQRLDELACGTTELLRILLRVCEAVALAHARGVVHCDLKPQNVMTGTFGEVLVMDWGVARTVDESRVDANTRVLAGTRGFMAPEQERGEPVDARADVYALGAMLRALLVAPPKLLRAIIDKATAADRDARYANAGELAADLVRYLDGAPLAAYRENAFERAGRWLARNRALVAVVVAYLIMRVIVLIAVHR